MTDRDAVKTDNASLDAKLLLRTTMLDLYHPTSFTVFDACQGEGVLWSHLRRRYGERVTRYWGTDLKAERGRMRVDSRRIMSSIREDVVDIDTYGEPWDHLMSLLAGPRQPRTVFLTVGHRMDTSYLQSKQVLGRFGFEHLPHLRTGLFKGEIGDWVTSAMILDIVADERYVTLDMREGLPKGRMARYFGIRIEPVKARATA